MLTNNLTYLKKYDNKKTQIIECIEYACSKYAKNIVATIFYYCKQQ